MVPPASQTWVPGQGPLPPPAKQGTDREPNSWVSDSTKKNLIPSLSNFITGFSQGCLIPFSSLSSFLSDDLRKAQFHIGETFLLYLFYALMVDFVENKLEENHEKGGSEIAYWGGTSTFFVLNAIVFVHLLINTTIASMAVNAAASNAEQAIKPEENQDKKAKRSNPPSALTDDPHACRCDVKLTLPALLNDPLTKISSKLLLTLLRSIPTWGPPAATIYASIVYGNALVESRLSMCVDHRRDYIRQHIFSVMGYGASFLALAGLAYRIIHQSTGLGGTLLYDALFIYFYDQAIINAWRSNMHFRVDHFQFDPSYIFRRALDSYIADATPKIMESLSMGQKSPSSIDKLMDSINHPAVRALTSIDLRQKDLALNNPNVQLYVTMIQPTLIKIIAGVAQIPSNNGVYYGNKLYKWGQIFGFELPGTALASNLRTLTKAGYFYREYLQEWANSICMAAGVPPIRIEGKNASEEFILDDPDDVFYESPPQIPEPESEGEEEPAPGAIILNDRAVVIDESYVPGGSATARTLTSGRTRHGGTVARVSKNGVPLKAQSYGYAETPFQTKSGKPFGR